MRMKALRILKTVTVSAVALVMIVSGTLHTTIGVSAAETVKSTSNASDGSGVIYVEYSDVNPQDYWGKKAPKYSGVDDENGVGYFFGGWYTKNGDVYKPVESEDGLIGTVVAKFVPAQTMSVKCQNWAGTDVNSNAVIVRVISATDSKNYEKFGFVISKIKDGTKTLLKTYETEEVYKTFNYYESKEDTEPTPYKPADLFGTAASHFTTCTVGRITKADHGTIVCIKPFWVTLDGIEVYGLSKFAHVEDGYLHYVNVPVNLNILSEGKGAAVGILKVTAPEGLKFIEAEDKVRVERGQVFEEMEFNVLDERTIRCIGDSTDLEDKEEMDVFVNLRFERTTSVDNDAPVAEEFYKFTVDEEDFSNAEEKLFEDDDLDVWNIIY